MYRKTLIATAVIAALTGCGGGGGSSGTDSGSGTVSAFVTDNLATDYTEVWVTIQRVIVENNASESVTVFDDAAGKVVNLATLANVGTLLNTLTIPAGTYNDIRVTVDNSLRLVDSNGAVTNAVFSPSGSSYTLDVDGNLSVADGQSTAFALDFDLAQFTLDPATSVVTPVVIYKDDAEVERLGETNSEIDGVIQSVASSTSFTLIPEHSTVPITINLGNATVLYDDETDQVLSGVSALVAGAAVEVRGSYDAGTQTVSATEITLDDGSGSDDDNGGLTEVSGTVQSYDGSTLVLDVRDADFWPGGNTISVANVTNATFTEGTLAGLQASGQEVEVKGTWDGTTFTAAAVKIEGAEGESNDTADSSAEDDGAESSRS